MLVTFGISIDAAAWRAHADSVRDSVHAADAALIPVIKGNGYGLGQTLLAQEATRLGVRAVAVGNFHEVAEVAASFAGDIIVLEPVDPRDVDATAAWAGIADSELHTRVIRTIASSEGLDFVLDTASEPRIIIEAATAMRRFGFALPNLRSSWAWALQAAADGRLKLQGLTLHLPLSPSVADIDEILEIADEIETDGIKHLLLSHVNTAQLDVLKRHNLNLRFSLRIGTDLWLGNRKTLTAFGTVLAVTKVQKGQKVGYHQRAARGNGHVLTVSGGTAHGIGLAAPSPARSFRQKLTVIGVAVFNTMGRMKSPFAIGRHELWFAEPPHQQVSMLWLPSDMEPPAIGTELTATVRFTTTHADIVHCN